MLGELGGVKGEIEGRRRLCLLMWRIANAIASRFNCDDGMEIL